MMTYIELSKIVENTPPRFTKLEMELAQIVLDDRKAFHRLRDEIAPMAQRVLDPPDNTFTRQLKQIDSRLP